MKINNMELNDKTVFWKGNRENHPELVITAHQDDIEIMCPYGIIKNFNDKNAGMTAVVVTDGGGSPRAGAYADYTYDQMVKVRQQEQIDAAKMCEYADLVMLQYKSAEIKDKNNQSPVNDLVEIYKNYRPEVVYIHNLADKHATHIAVANKCIEALRQLPKELRPKKLYGCECWRNLDWMPDEDKVSFDVSGEENDKLLMRALGAHVSQVMGGKRYDLAVQGRRISNATFGASHACDTAKQISLAMDLTPLLLDDTIVPRDFVIAYVEKFKSEIL